VLKKVKIKYQNGQKDGDNVQNNERPMAPPLSSANWSELGGGGWNGGQIQDFKGLRTGFGFMKMCDERIVFRTCSGQGEPIPPRTKTGCGIPLTKDKKKPLWGTHEQAKKSAI